MAEIKQDLRIKRTQRSLALAMLTLLETRNFGKITVNDLCTEAMVSRSAFYAHFEDKYALLGFCLGTLKQQMFEKSEGQDLRARVLSVLQYVRDNEKMFRHLLMAEMNAELMEMLRQAFQDDLVRLLDGCRGAGVALPGPLDVVSVYYASGIASTIIYWVSRNMPYTTAEMADCLYALLPAGLAEQAAR